MTGIISEQQISAHKELASAVLQSMIVDARVYGRETASNRAARSALTSPHKAAVRAVWLQWLGFSESGFQALLAKGTFQGNENLLVGDNWANQQRGIADKRKRLAETRAAKAASKAQEDAHPV